MRPTSAPATLTHARETRCTTALIVYHPTQIMPPRKRHEVVARSERTRAKWVAPGRPGAGPHRSWSDLVREAAAVDGLALGPLEHDLADADPRIQRERRAGHVH